MKTQEPSTTFWHEVGTFIIVSKGLPACWEMFCNSLLDVSPCCCGHRSDTGRLWQILRMSGGERRSLWKMPSSLVSQTKQSCAYCRACLNRKCWPTTFLSPHPVPVHCKTWHNAGPGLLVPGLTRYFFYISSCVLSGLSQWWFCDFFLNKTRLVQLSVILLTRQKLQVLL